jgi:small GTP-binding protein
MRLDRPIAQKICVLGEFGAGKTSLVNRIVNQTFGKDYLSTIGVRTVAHTLRSAAGNTAHCVFWDIAGEAQLSKLTAQYARGAKQCLFVADPLRPNTVAAAVHLFQSLKQCSTTPFLASLVFTKADLMNEWTRVQDLHADIASLDWRVFVTSALSGKGIDELSHHLATQALQTDPARSL